jgi:HSP90 family molecular chaperone
LAPRSGIAARCTCAAGAEPTEVADGIALWTKPKAEITPADYADFYRGLTGHFDEPALTVERGLRPAA